MSQEEGKIKVVINEGTGNTVHAGNINMVGQKNIHNMIEPSGSSLGRQLPEQFKDNLMTNEQKFQNDSKEINKIDVLGRVDETKSELNPIKINEKDYQAVFDKKHENEFEQIEKIGQGSFGSVYKVKAKSNETHYAIKILEIKRDMNLNEILLMVKLNTKFVVQYINSWIDTNLTRKEIKLYIQMELCEQNFREFLKLKLDKKTTDTFNYFISCQLFKELIECVNSLHSLNPPVIHRDLKPENILISEGINGRSLKLCDFGLAKFHDKSSHTRMVGSWNYMAPEVLHSRNYNTKSDIYSLAVIGTEIFEFEDKIERIRDCKTREEFDKYLTKYSDQIKPKFIKLLDLLSKCLTPEEKEYNTRPECSELLDKIKETFIDKNLVLFDINSMNLLNMWEFGKRLLV